ncbi:MAG: aminotransferase class V-fold PLP-dependent enzyme [Eubacteriales bacterium]
MQKIYLDQASTSFPKAPGTAEAVSRFITECGCNIARGGYAGAYSAEELVFDTRTLVKRLFGGGDEKNAVFTENVTESLNILLKGFLRPGDHVLVSSMEHNAVMRPLVQLEKKGVRFTRVPCAADGSMDPADAEALIEPATKAVVMLHASNVCGTVLPVAEIGAICRTHGIRFILDAAQTAGVLPVGMDDTGADAIAFTGHKGLLGPQGTGGILIRDDLAAETEPLIAGGTGSISHTEEIPDFLPDRFEAGTLNLPGIAGLNAALSWLASRPAGSILAHELKLTERFLRKMEELEEEGHIRIIGKHDIKDRTGVVSIVPLHRDPAEVGFLLDDRYGIATRVGLHCAPAAHRTLGTWPTGTVRFSFGIFNTEAETDEAAEAVAALCREEGKAWK